LVAGEFFEVFVGDCREFLLGQGAPAFWFGRGEGFAAPVVGEIRIVEGQAEEVGEIADDVAGVSVGEEAEFLGDAGFEILVEVDAIFVGVAESGGVVEVVEDVLAVGVVEAREFGGGVAVVESVG
jgi:hypothetical protein